jgi:hypothetical protein
MQAQAFDEDRTRQSGRSFDVWKAVEHSQRSRIATATRRVARPRSHEHRDLGQPSTQSLETPGQCHDGTGRRIGAIEDVARNDDDVRRESHHLLHGPIERSRDIPLPHIRIPLDPAIGAKAQVQI